MAKVLSFVHKNPPMSQHTAANTRKSHFIQIHFNIILSNSPKFTDMSFLFGSSTEILYIILVYSVRATYPLMAG